MSEAYARRLLQNAITSIKSGERNLARKYLDRFFMAGGNYDMLADGWFYMSEVCDDPAEKRKALESALSYRMSHPRARRALAILDGKLKVEDVVNPDALPAPNIGDREANAERFTCPGCGGRMSFSPDGQALVCDFCAAQEGIDVRGESAEEQDFFTAMATLRGHSKPVARQVFHCAGCGAEFLLPPETISATCAYCASPHVVSLDEARELLDPDAIIPQAFDRRRATQILIEWVQSHRFTPHGKVMPPRGFYFPVWTFDVGGTIGYRGQRREEEEFGFQRKTVIKNERGDYPVYIDDLLIPASDKFKKLIPDLIASYNLRDAKPYNARYLSSWPAEAYQVALGDASLEARSRAFKLYRKKVAMDMSHLENLKTSSANLAIDSYKLLLLPVWTTTYSYDQREYIVLINGQSESVIGQPPKSKRIAGKLGNDLLSWIDGLLEH